MPPPTRHHHLRLAADQALEAPALDAPISRLAVEQEDLGQADARLALDLAVELDERLAQFGGERASERGLAGAAQADERDALAPRRGFLAVVAHQPEDDVLEPVRRQAVEEAADQPLFDRALARIDELGERHREGARDAAEQEHRRVAFAGFELREIALGDAGALRHRLAREPPPFARLPHLSAERRQERGVLGIGIRRGGGRWAAAEASAGIDPGAAVEGVAIYCIWIAASSTLDPGQLADVVRGCDANCAAIGGCSSVASSEHDLLCLTCRKA